MYLPSSHQGKLNTLVDLAHVSLDKNNHWQTNRRNDVKAGTGSQSVSQTDRHTGRDRQTETNIQIERQTYLSCLARERCLEEI